MRLAQCVYVRTFRSDNSTMVRCCALWPVWMQLLSCIGVALASHCHLLRVTVNLVRFALQTTPYVSYSKIFAFHTHSDAVNAFGFWQCLVNNLAISHMDICDLYMCHIGIAPVCNTNINFSSRLLILKCCLHFHVSQSLPKNQFPKLNNIQTT